MTLSRPLILLLFLSAASPLRAAEENPEYARAKADAAKAFAAKDYAGAAQLFEQAFNAEPRGNLLYNIGLCWERSGQIVKAVVFYQRFVQAAPGSAKRPAVKRKIATLQRQLGDRYVEVSVSSSPAGALVFVDDKAKGAMGVTPLTVKLLPGRYTIIAELTDYEPAQQKIQLTEGRSETVDLRLIGSERVGTLTLLISERGAAVQVDGHAVGSSPLQRPLRLAAGRHRVEVKKEGFGTFERRVEVRAGAEDRLQISLSGEGGGQDPGDGLPPAAAQLGGGGAGGGPGIWPWAVAGVGAAAIGGGVFTGLSAQRLHDQLTTKKDNADLIAPADIDSGNSLVLMTNVLYGVGGAALVGGLAWWWLTADSGPRASGEILGLGVGPDGAPMVELGGRF